jgi:hypothetical protein
LLLPRTHIYRSGDSSYKDLKHAKHGDSYYIQIYLTHGTENKRQVIINQLRNLEKVWKVTRSMLL